MADTGIKYAGEVQLDYVEIVSSNGVALTVTAHTMALEIYEDIFDNFLTGKLYLSDSQALTNFFPLSGQEFVRFSFITPSLDDEQKYSGEFFIYKATDQKQVANSSACYVLSFISKEGVIDLNKKLSKTFKGNPSDMIEELLGDTGLQTEKDYYLENTANTFAFIANWWNPTKCIQYITDHAVNRSDSPTFLFFENKHGFTFGSLSALMDSEIPVLQEFKLDNYHRTASSQLEGSSVRDISEDYKRIRKIEYKNGFDYIERLKSGYYGGEIITFDTAVSQYTHNAISIDFSENCKLNPYSPVPDTVPITTHGFIKYLTKHYNNFNGQKDSTNSEYLIRRKTLLSRLLNSTRLKIMVDGRTDYNIGMKVKVTIPKNAPLQDDKDNTDKLLSGTYLVTSIAHTVTSEKHTCVMELMKESYLIDLNKPNTD